MKLKKQERENACANLSDLHIYSSWVKLNLK